MQELYQQSPDNAIFISRFRLESSL